MGALPLLILLGLQLDVAVPGAAADQALVVEVRPVDNIGTFDIVHRNAGRAPIVVRTGWACGLPSFDRLIEDGRAIDPPSPRPECDDNFLVTRRLAPGESYATRLQAPYAPGRHTVYAEFKIVDETGFPRRRLRSRAIAIDVPW